MLQKLKSFLFENTTTRQTVAKNTVWLSISNFGGRLLKAVIIIYAARVLGTAGYGVFSYAVTLAGFFTLFIDPGINSILMRDISKSSEEKRIELFSATFAMKVVLIAAAVLIVAFVAPFFSTLPGASALLPIVALIITFDSLREFFSSFVRAREKMEWEAGIFLLTSASIVGAGFLFLAISPTALSLGWAYVVGTAIGALAATFVIRNYLAKIFSKLSSSLALIKPIVVSAWPFAVTGALGILLTNTDILVISWLRSASDVGIYSAAVRIVQVLYIVPTVIQYSTLPLFARLANTDNAKFRTVFERTVGLIFLSSVPLALGGAVLGTQVMRLVFGASYAAGGLSFKILMLTMLVDYPATIIAAAIFAYNHQKGLIKASAIGGISNLVFDLVLIPIFGIAGSAVATLLAQIFSNWYLWHTMKKINYFEVFPNLRKIFIAGTIMAAMSVLFYVAGIGIILNVLFCATLYLALLFSFREPLLIEVKSVLRASGDGG